MATCFIFAMFKTRFVQCRTRHFLASSQSACQKPTVRKVMCRCGYCRMRTKIKNSGTNTSSQHLVWTDVNVDHLTLQSVSRFENSSLYHFHTWALVKFVLEPAPGWHKAQGILKTSFVARHQLSASQWSLFVSSAITFRHLPVVDSSLKLNYQVEPITSTWRRHTCSMSFLFFGSKARMTFSLAFRIVFGGILQCFSPRSYPQCTRTPPMPRHTPAPARCPWKLLWPWAIRVLFPAWFLLAQTSELLVPWVSIHLLVSTHLWQVARSTTTWPMRMQQPPTMQHRRMVWTTPLSLGAVPPLPSLPNAHVREPSLLCDFQALFWDARRSA